jgi:hypothetical protein
LLGGCEIDGAEFSLITEAETKFNRALSGNTVINKEEKNIITKRLTDLMEARISEGDADDLSKLSWLYLHQGESSKAKIIAEKGLDMDPQNPHCLKLIRRLEETTWW